MLLDHFFYSLMFTVGCWVVIIRPRFWFGQRQHVGNILSNAWKTRSNMCYFLKPSKKTMNSNRNCIIIITRRRGQNPWNMRMAASGNQSLQWRIFPGTCSHWPKRSVSKCFRSYPCFINPRRIPSGKLTQLLNITYFFSGKFNYQWFLPIAKC